MTDSVVRYLLNFGLNVETRDRPNPRLKAFRRSLYFPELLFELKLSGHREERFLVKLEAEDQKISYDTKIIRIRMDGFFFPVSVPEDPVLCAMKLAAMLDRRKGRDFYDSIFLLSRVMPDYHFLGCSCGIHNSDQLFRRIMEVLNEVDLSHKARDFEQLVFRQGDQLKILNAADYFEDILG